MKPETLAESIASWLNIWGLLGGVLIGGGILLIQLYWWAKTGEWLSLPVGVVFVLLGFELEWVYEPTDWVGVAKVIRLLLEQLPLSLTCLFGIPMVTELFVQMFDPD